MHPLARSIACGDLVSEFARDNNHTDAKRRSVEVSGNAYLRGERVRP
jgi:hypothetical protein